MYNYIIRNKIALSIYKKCELLLLKWDPGADETPK